MGDREFRALIIAEAAFPSVRESGGGVVLEAMATGVAPLVVDYGGPADLVDDQVSFPVTMGSPTEAVARVRRVLDAVVEDPSLLDGKGDRARQRTSTQHTWNARADAILSVYRWLLGRQGRPNLDPPRRA